MASYYITTQQHAAIRRAARMLQAEYTRRGARGVLTTKSEYTMRRVLLGAGVAPAVHHRDASDHTAACLAWL